MPRSPRLFGGNRPCGPFLALLLPVAAAGDSPLWADAPPALVINEIHYDENDKTLPAEFIELFNAGEEPVDAGGWRFDGGVEFAFPAGTVVPPGGFVVVAEDPETVRSLWGVDGAYRWTSGRLRNGGEEIVLRDAAGGLVDRVDYRLGFPWPTVGDEPSPSIELIHPALPNDVGGNWRASGFYTPGPSSGPLVARESTGWRFRRGTSEPATDGGGRPWTDAHYDEAADGAWEAAGRLPLGFGDGDDNTELDDMQGGYITVFLRREFEIEPGRVPPALTLNLLFDDGVVVWINGREVARRSVAPGAIPFPPPSGFASSHEAGDYEEVVVSGAAGLLVEGANVLAVQLINQSLSSSDATVDVELLSGGGAGGPGPGEPTPGAVNSVFALSAPPAVRKVDHEPRQPVSGEPVAVTAVVTDPEGVLEVELDLQVVEPGDFIEIVDPRYETEWTSLPMRDDGEGGDAVAGDDVFTAVVPPEVQVHRRLVRYRIRAVDGGGAGVRVPHLDDPQPNFAWFVYDGVPAWTGAARPGVTDPVTYDFEAMPPLPVYHLVTTRRAHVDAQFIPDSTRGSGYTGSDYLWHGALVYDGEVHDHVRFRARGGVWRYAMGKNMWKFDFNRGHRLEARDNFGRRYGTGWDKLNLGANIQQGNFNHRGEQGLFESVGFRLFNLAGVEGPNTHYVHFRIVDRADEDGAPGNQFDTDFQGLYLAVEQMDGRFLDEHGLPDGNLYKMESGTGDLNNQGPGQPDDKSDLNAFFAYKSRTQDEAWWRENLDLDRYYGYRTIVEGIHHYDIAAGKNYFYFHNPETGRWQVHPWDLDLTWADNMYGSGQEDFNSRVALRAPFREEYWNRARELLDLLFNEEQTGMIIDETMRFVHREGEPSFVDADRAMWDFNPILVSRYVNSSKAGHGRFYQSAVSNPRDFPGMAEKMRRYVTSRTAFLENSVMRNAASIPAKPTITYVGAPDFVSTGLAFECSAFSSPTGAEFGAMKWRLAEVSDPSAPTFDPDAPRRFEIEADWESGELGAFASRIEVPASAVRPGRHYRARVRHRDAGGLWSRWSDPVALTAAAPDSGPFEAGLVVSEIMYHPAPPTADELAVDPAFTDGDFEWLELMNVGPAALPMRDLRITRGVDFDFADGSVETLEPGARLVVVRNPAAFAARYGHVVPAGVVAGAWQSGDALDNAGESVRLSLGAGIVIREFTYGDDAPWPEAADGAGFSLVLSRPGDRPDGNDPRAWRSSVEPGGTPGFDDSRPLPDDPGADADGDGFNALAEYFFGTDEEAADAAVPGLAVAPDASGDGRAMTFAFERALSADGATFVVETSLDGVEWRSEPDGVAFVREDPVGGGRARVVFSVVPGAHRLFFRIRISERLDVP